MGTAAVAAVNLENSIERLAFVAFIGIASASAAILGQELGAGRCDTARQYAKEMIKVTLITAVAVSAVTASGGVWLLSVYDVSPDLINSTVILLYIFALILPMRAFNALNIVGILRSGGDTKAALYIDTGAQCLSVSPSLSLPDLYSDFLSGRFSLLPEVKSW